MELFRVMAPRGRLFILINLYKDNRYSLQWVDKLKVPVHVRSAAEYIELLKKHAFENVEARRIPDDTPTPDDYKTKSFNSLEDLRAFKRRGRAAADGFETRSANSGSRDTPSTKYDRRHDVAAIAFRGRVSGRSLDIAVVVILVLVAHASGLSRGSRHGHPVHDEFRSCHSRLTA